MVTLRIGAVAGFPPLVNSPLARWRKVLGRSSTKSGTSDRGARGLGPGPAGKDEITTGTTTIAARSARHQILCWPLLRLGPGPRRLTGCSNYCRLALG